VTVLLVVAQPRSGAGRRERLGAGRRQRLGGDDGSATVLLLGVVGALVVVASLLAALGSAQLGRARAQSAADLGALAAAEALRSGGVPDPCQVAAQTVERNGATLVSCTDEGQGVMLVRAERNTVAGTASAQARAGPATARRP